MLFRSPRPHPSNDRYERADPHPVARRKKSSEKRSVRRAPPRSDPSSLVTPGGSGVSAPSDRKHPYPASETTYQRQSRHCSWGRWPRFPQLALRPHPSNDRDERADSHPVARRKKSSEKRSVRRTPPRSDPASLQRPGGSGVSAPSYRKHPYPASETTYQRQSRHCSWGRWPRFPQLALRPHPSPATVAASPPAQGYRIRILG